MVQKGLLIGLCLLLMISGTFGCGSSGDSNGSEGLSIALSATKSRIVVGEELSLLVVATDSSGQEVTGLNFIYSVNIPAYATVSAEGVVEGQYPGRVELTASAEGSESNVLELSIDPPENSQSITQLTNSSDRDDWGFSNRWKTLVSGKVIWSRSGGINTEIFLHDLIDPVGTNTSLDSFTGSASRLALGTGANVGTLMSAWRVDDIETWVNNNGESTTNLGDRSQEENSIDKGCLFFRAGDGKDDIELFQLGPGLQVLATLNELRDPVVWNCQAVWVEILADGSHSLIYYDGVEQNTVVSGINNFPQHDFKEGQLVYIEGGDVFHVDLTSDDLTPQPITSDAEGLLDQRPKTDGQSIVWIQIDPVPNDWKVLLYEILTGETKVISTNTNEKVTDSLAIDLKQVVWLDFNPKALYFHPGTGDSTDTLEVPLGTNDLVTEFYPYVENGVITWIAEVAVGNTEVFVMQ